LGNILYRNGMQIKIAHVFSIYVRISE